MAKRQPFVLALSSSPRKKGNSDILCDRVIAGAKAAGAKVEKYYLNDMTIKPCVACGACQEKRIGRCVFDDDMRKLYPLLKKCDGLILAGPVYFFTVSAQLKLFLDKLYPLTSENGLKLGAKRAVTCLTYGAPDALLSGCDNAARTLNDIFTFANVPVRFIHASAWQKGEVRQRSGALKRAREAGQELVAG
jgi:multimeric flavodoxin WrbA